MPKVFDSDLSAVFAPGWRVATMVVTVSMAITVGSWWALIWWVVVR